MKIQRIILLVVGIVFSTLFVVGANADGLNVQYTGDTRAKDICKAVVEDNLGMLQRTLAMQKRSMLYGYQYALRSDEVAGRFICNGMDLQDFSAAVGASDISSYFATGEGALREQFTSAHN